GVAVIHPKHAELYDAAKHGVRHATTLGGNCLSMAVTAKLFEVMERDGLVERAAELGAHVHERLKPLVGRGVVQETRGHGLFLGIQVDVDALQYETARHLVLDLLDKGVMINATKTGVIRLAPPLTIETERLDEGLDVLIGALGSG
ncbi:MAG: aminotransferase class III-fold pyridoxal phosphate-dependent enzyme, partial [Planctomycetota bacterium]